MPKTKRGTTYSGLAKVQHYVSQCLLRGFATGRSTGKHEQIWVCDKQSEREPYETAIKNVAAEKGFYNVPTSTGVATFEPLLTRLEDRFAEVASRIRRERSIGGLSNADREILAFFAVAQMFRTNSFRLLMSDMTRQLAEVLKKDALNTGVPKAAIDQYVFGAKEMTPEEVKAQTLRTLSMAPSFAPLLLEKSLVLVRAEAGQHFLISDNPAAMYNMRDRWPRGSLGLGVEGIELYLPISHDLLLWWICPSYELMMREQVAKHSAFLPFAIGDRRKTIERLLNNCRRFLDAIDLGAPLEYGSDAVLHANSLQVIYAERFVFAYRNDFALVREMVGEDPTLRLGRRMVVE